MREWKSVVPPGPVRKWQSIGMEPGAEARQLAKWR